MRKIALFAMLWAAIPSRASDSATDLALCLESDQSCHNVLHVKTQRLNEQDQVIQRLTDQRDACYRDCQAPPKPLPWYLPALGGFVAGVGLAYFGYRLLR